MKKYHHILWAVAALALPMLFTACDERITEPEEQEPVPEEVHTEEVDGTICVSEKYVDVDWQESTNKVLVADTASGHFVLRTDAETAKSIKKGSLLTLDCDSTIFLRKVLSARRNGNEVEMETEEGSMAELYAGSHFVVFLGDVPDTVHFYNAQGQIIRPIRPNFVRLQDEDGEWYRVPLSLTRYQSGEFNIGGTTPIKIDLPLVNYSKGGAKVEVKANTSIQLHTIASLAIEFDFDLSFFNEGSLLDLKFMTVRLFQKPDYAFDIGLSAWAGLSLADKIKFDKANKDKYYETVGTSANKQSKNNGAQDVDLGDDMPESSFDLNFTPGFDFDIAAGVGAGFGVNTEFTSDGRGTSEITCSAHAIPTFPYVKFDNDFSKAFDHTRVKVRPYLYAEGDVHISAGLMPGLELSINGSNVISAGAGINFEAEAKGGVYLGGEFDTERAATMDVAPTWHQNASFKFSWSIKYDKEYIKNMVGGVEVLKKFFDVESINWGGISAEWSDDLGSYDIWDAPCELKPLTKEENIFLNECNMVECIVTAKESNKEIDCPIPVLLKYQIEDGAEELSLTTNGPWVSSETQLVEGRDGYIFWKPKSEDSRLIVKLFLPSNEIKEVMFEPKGGIKPKEVTNVEAIDMGDGLEWGNMNVGADNPWEYGDYVGWGAKHSSTYYQWDDPKADNYMSFEHYIDTYSSDDSQSYADNTLDIGGSSRDYAKRKWGGKWRTPTALEWQSLLKNCTWTLTTNNGVTGYDVKSNDTGNHIFLPRAGYRIGSTKKLQGTIFDYWTSNQYETIYESDDPDWFDFTDHYHMAWDVCDNTTIGLTLSHSQKCYGYPIRPVRSAFDFSDE